MPTDFKLYDVKEEDLFANKTDEEKEKLLYPMVENALKYGIKPTAREFNTYPGTVRRWLKKSQEGGIEALKISKKH